MNQDQWKQLKEHFDKISEATTSEQNQYLEALKSEDPLLHDELQKLLQEFEETGTTQFFGAQASAKFQTQEPESTSLIGTTIDRYQLESLIGIGGMGKVFLAKRIDLDAHQEVALKLIHAVQVSPLYRQRFVRERKILSKLNHPHITRLYDGGLSENGEPYYVMEYVPGATILEYARENNLDLEARLQLFKDVCSGVEYAHQNFILHRDLKPANILVTDNGIAKIIDFGIAKITEEEEQSDNPEITVQGFIPFTPAYASPEQMRGQDLTPVADLYSLGVILYELLTDNKPYKASATTNIAERFTQDRKITKPSSNISQDLLKTKNSWNKKIQGDLDLITLKCLKEDPAERYPSVRHLIDDIERHQNKFPILARPDSLSYRVRKFVQRNKSLTALYAALLLAVVGGIITTSTQAAIATNQKNIAQLEAQKANEIKDFVIGLFENSNPNVEVGKVLTSENMLDIGAERVEEIEGQPLVKAEMHAVLGRLFKLQDQNKKSQAQYKKALKIHEQENSPIDDIDMMMNELANSYMKSSMYDSSIAVLIELERRMKETRFDQPALYLSSCAMLAQISFSTGQTKDSEDIIQNALQWAEKQEYLPEEAYTALLNMKRIMGYNHLISNRPEDAAVQFTNALSIMDQKVMNNAPTNRLIFLSDIATAYMMGDQLDSAKVYSEKGIALAKQIQNGKPSVTLAKLYTNMFEVYKKKSSFQDAMQYSRLALDTYLEMHPDSLAALVSVAFMDMGEAHLGLKNMEEFEKYSNIGLKISEEFFGENKTSISFSYFDMAQTYSNAELHDKALFYHRKYVSIYAEQESINNFEKGEAYDILGQFLYNAGQMDSVEHYLMKGIDYYKLDGATYNENIRSALELLIDLFTQNGNEAKVSLYQDQLDNLELKN